MIDFLRSVGFRKFTNDVTGIFTDQLSAHVERIPKKQEADILWRLSVNGGTNNVKQEYIGKHHIRKRRKSGGSYNKF